MKRKNSEKGFTLIELLLVVVIIGLMLAVIVPRAWRANIDAKYGLVRQNCSELASFGQLWAENQLLAQNEQFSTATMDNYLQSLTVSTAGGAVAYDTETTWVADNTGATNWSNSGAAGVTSKPGEVTIEARTIASAPPVAGGIVPESTVEGMVPPEKTIRNPFNEVNVFSSVNDPAAQTQAVTGAISCGTIADNNVSAGNEDNWRYYAFLFQGTDSTTFGPQLPASYHAGMDPTSLPGLRNGIFFARVRAASN